MADEPSRLEWDLLSEKERLSQIREKLDDIEERLVEVREDKPSLMISLRTIFSWRNYSVYLATSWVFTAFSYMGLFLNLYLLEELSWDILLIGGVLSFSSALSAISRFVGGYVGDVSNRKYLSVIAMFMMAIYNIIMGISDEFTWIFIAFLFFSAMDIFKGGSTAFIMDNIPKRHAGLGISLFSAGGFLGIITLGVFVILIPSLGFKTSLQLMFLTGGLFLVICTIVRSLFLEGSVPENKRKGVSLFRDFIQENKRATELLFKAVPGMIAIVVLDSLSDSLFRFGAYIYIYQQVGIEITGLALMSIATILISVPMMLATGRMSDRKGEKKTALVVYGIMPISSLLLLIAPIFPFWAPNFLLTHAESVFTGLSVIFSTPFLAIVLKSANDAVWTVLILIIIQKNLPRKDTSKILSVFWFIVYLLASIGPSIGGFVFEFLYQGYLFVIVLMINIIILGWIAARGLVKDDVFDKGK